MGQDPFVLTPSSVLEACFLIYERKILISLLPLSKGYFGDEMPARYECLLSKIKRCVNGR